MWSLCWCNLCIPARTLTAFSCDSFWHLENIDFLQLEDFFPNDKSAKFTVINLRDCQWSELECWNWSDAVQKELMSAQFDWEESFCYLLWVFHYWRWPTWFIRSELAQDLLSRIHQIPLTHTTHLNPTKESINTQFASTADFHDTFNPSHHQYYAIDSYVIVFFFHVYFR